MLLDATVSVYYSVWRRSTRRNPSNARDNKGDNKRAWKRTIQHNNTRMTRNNHKQLYHAPDLVCAGRVVFNGSFRAREDSVEFADQPTNSNANQLKGKARAIKTIDTPITPTQRSPCRTVIRVCRSNLTRSMVSLPPTTLPCCIVLFEVSRLGPTCAQRESNRRTPIKSSQRGLEEEWRRWRNADKRVQGTRERQARRDLQLQLVSPRTPLVSSHRRRRADPISHTQIHIRQMSCN